MHTSCQPPVNKYFAEGENVILCQYQKTFYEENSKDYEWYSSWNDYDKILFRTYCEPDTLISYRVSKYAEYICFIINFFNDIFYCSLKYWPFRNFIMILLKMC